MMLGQWKLISLIMATLVLSGCASTEQLNFSTAEPVDQVDTDKDGVINVRDNCADTPLGATIDNDGCPNKVTTSKRNDLVVLFGHDSAAIDSIQLIEIKKAVRLLKQEHNLKIVLEGHTSASGSTGYNQKLSEQRAEAVRKAFISRGLAASRIAILPRGESSLLLKAETPQADSLNRRVTAQFKLVNETTDYKWHIYTMEESL